MYFWKAKDGSKLSFKEFRKRFLDGISEITPLQKLQNDSRSTFTMFFGYLVGLVSLIVYRKAFVVQWFTYALIIIFLGAAWSNGINWWVIRLQVKNFKGFNSNAVDLNKLMDSLEEVKEDEDINKIEESMKENPLTEDVIMEFNAREGKGMGRITGITSLIPWDMDKYTGKSKSQIKFSEILDKEKEEKNNGFI